MYGYQSTWMAWIPYLQYYALADAALGKKEKVKFLSMELTPTIFKFWWVVTVIACFISNPALNLAVIIARTICLGTVFAYIFAGAEGKDYDNTKYFSLVVGWLPIIAIVKFLSYDKNRCITEM